MPALYLYNSLNCTNISCQPYGRWLESAPRSTPSPAWERSDGDGAVVESWNKVEEGRVAGVGLTLSLDEPYFVLGSHSDCKSADGERFEQRDGDMLLAVEGVPTQQLSRQEIAGRKSVYFFLSCSVCVCVCVCARGVCVCVYV